MANTIDDLIANESKNFNKGASKASNISSLSNTLSKHQNETNNTVNSVTKSLQNIAKEQKNTAKDMRIKEVGFSKGIKEVEKSMNIIVKKLGYTIDEFGKGTKKIVAQTATATKDTLKQYTRAIGEDINVNKQNLLAMTLSRSSPIFGYFAAKFMETDVFRKAKERIQQSLAAAFSVIGMKMKEWWTKGKEKGRELVDKVKTKWKDRKEEKKIPALASGGVVTKTGAAKIHAAEVVGPVDKLGKIFSESMVATFSRSKELKSFSRTFDILRKSIISPLKFLFKPRGGYIAKVPHSGNVFNDIAVTLGLIYADTQPKLDAIVNIFRNVGQALTGKEQQGVQTKTWTMWERGRDFLQGKNKEKWRQQTITDIMSKLDLDTKVAQEQLDKLTNAFKKGNKETVTATVKVLPKKMETVMEPVVDSVNKLGKHMKGGFEGMLMALMSLVSIIGGIFGKAMGLVGKIPGFGKLVGPKSLPGVDDKTSSTGGAASTTGGTAAKGKGIRMQRPSAAGLAAGLSGAAVMGMDALTGISKADEWGTSKTSAGIGAALGGTTGGVEGAMSGAAKGAAMGALVGSIFPGIGTAIGGSIGAIAGGILGFIGGENIAKGLDSLWDSLKDLVSGVQDLITFPFRVMYKAAIRLKDTISDSFSSFWGWINDKMDGFPTRMIEWLTGSLPDWAKQVMGMKVTAPATKAVEAQENYSLMGQHGDSDPADVPEKLKFLENAVESPSSISKAQRSKQVPKDIMLGAATPDIIAKKLEDIKAESDTDPMAAGSNIKMLDTAPFPNQSKDLARQYGVNALDSSHIDRINPGMYKALIEMGQEYKQKTGSDITVTDGFRSMDEQMKLYREKPGLAAPPGRSMHQFGVALDVGTKTGNELDNLGLLEKYGFTRPMYPGKPGGKVEPWHIEPAAIQGKYNDIRSGNFSGIGKDFDISQYVTGSTNFTAESVQPGTFGWLSRMFESGGAGPGSISSGAGDFGGKSYGSYQLSSSRGVVQDFLRQSGYDKKITGDIGSASFDAKWREVSQTDPKFADAQNEYIKSKYMTPYMDAIKNSTGFDLSTRSPVLGEEVLSTAVQYGPGSSIIPRALQGMSTSSTDADILTKIGQTKLAGLDTNFRSSSAAVRAGVANRINKEISVALGQVSGSNTSQSVSDLKNQRGDAYNGPSMMIPPGRSIASDSFSKSPVSKLDIANNSTSDQMRQIEALMETAKMFQSATGELIKSQINSMANMSQNISQNISTGMTSIQQGKEKSSGRNGKTLENLITGDMD